MPTPEMWFLNCHATIRLSHRDNADGISVVALLMARNDAPPVHIHHTEDEIFCIMSGQVRFQIGDRTLTASPGEVVLAPQRVPHGFRVISDEAEMLVINKGCFEQLVRTASRPAERRAPPAMAEPTPEMQAELARHCLAADIELVGPPIP